MRQEGIELLLALLPSAHDWKDYRVEPFVLVGDVYAYPQHPGRGGWSWYTGTVGWHVQACRRYLTEYSGIIQIKSISLLAASCYN